MNVDRVKLLEKFAQEDPTDPFPIYALALEFIQAEPYRSEKLFSHLLKEHPDYIPTYYHAGLYYQSTGNSAKAKSVIETGIQKARAAGDKKTEAELRSLLPEDE